MGDRIIQHKQYSTMWPVRKWQVPQKNKKTEQNKRVKSVWVGRRQVVVLSEVSQGGLLMERTFDKGLE